MINIRKLGLSFLVLLLAFTLLKGIAWSLIVPLWHFPDEQAHFAHVAYLAEDRDEKKEKRDLNEEIAISEQLLGTFRDERGNNRFTFRPEYRIEYADNYLGIYEEEISSLPLETRTNYVANESAYYPHFFYQASGFIYKLFYQSNLFIRVFTIRLFWLWLQLLFIWLVWEIAKMVFPKNKTLAYAATSITALHPMLSFVSSGVTSDNLHNLLFTAAIYFSLRLSLKLDWKSFLGLAVSLAVGIINKQQFMIAVLVVAPIVVSAFFKNRRLWLKALIAVGVMVAIGLWLAPEHYVDLLESLQRGEIPYLGVGRNISVVRPDYGFIEHAVWTMRHTISEVLPWYWGVFNWLGVVLPRWVNRVFMRLLLVAGLGLALKAINIIKQRKMSREDWYLVYLTWAAAAYYLVLMIWDYFHVRSSGFPFGIQGRYYFPVVVSHMILLTAGINEVGEWLSKVIKKKITPLVIYSLAIWFVVAQLVALHTVTSAYYDLSNLNTFIIQASQYKPWFTKGWWLASSLLLYFGSLLGVIYFLTKKILLKNEK